MWKLIGIAVVILSIGVLFSAPAQAAGADGAACRAAISQKATCMGTRPNTPARTSCFKAAMQRCKQNGTGAI